MEDKVFNIVDISTNAIYHNKLFIVWSCYILGNRKFLVGVIDSNLYFEVTYNKDKNEWYVDRYIKEANTCIKDE